jgi:leucyl aminopeptidase
VLSGVSQSAIDRGRVVGESINQTRRLVNEPPAMIYPESFADRAAELASDAGLSIEIWDEPRLATEGCRAILAVGAGSSKKPRLVILRHDGGGDDPPIALVGKGVTFDSGGLSLKPSESMTDMKCDMAGAATVVGVMSAVARLGVKRNVIGFCGLAENMVSGDSYKLGDVIETRSGKTIEILNTDAEGRVVLADTLDVAVSYRPAAMVDLATLTGACMVALGNEVAGLMTNDQPLCDQLRSAADQVGEPVWQLPMFELYDEKVKSCIADIKNVGEGRWGGAITAAKFLQNFVREVPWVHIDIAGPAFAESPLPHRDAGATGVMVRTLVRWIEETSRQ